MRSGMRRVKGPPRVHDVYHMLRREDESNLGTAPKKVEKVNTDVTHGIFSCWMFFSSPFLLFIQVFFEKSTELERERGLTNRRKQAQEQLAVAKQELARALAGPTHDLGDQFIRPINIVSHTVLFLFSSSSKVWIFDDTAGGSSQSRPNRRASTLQCGVNTCWNLRNGIEVQDNQCYGSYCCFCQRSCIIWTTFLPLFLSKFSFTLASLLLSVATLLVRLLLPRDHHAWSTRQQLNLDQ